MALLEITSSSVIHGVSQQPPHIRRGEFAEELENAYVSVVNGLRKRQPSKHLAEVKGSTHGAGWLHAINRDSSERYLVSYLNGELRVNGTDGSVYTLLNIGAGSSATSISPTYLASASDPEQDIEAITVQDFTFVLNRQATASSSFVPVSYAYDNTAWVFVRSGAYLSNYTVTINWTDAGSVSRTATVTTSTWDGTTAAVGEISSIKTDDIATDLATKLAAVSAVNPASNFTAVANGSTLQIDVPAGVTLDSIVTTDSVGDTSLSGIQSEVARITDLPTTFREGAVVKVAGEQSDDDDFYVQFTGPASAAWGEGTWVESRDPGEQLAVDRTTLPHTLIRKQDDGAGTITGTPNAIYFEWALFEYDALQVGDSTSNPQPSFVGRQINNLFFWRNRLGFLADDFVCMSETGVYTNFYRSTVRLLLDSDRIDVGVGHSRVAKLYHAEAQEGRLILFSDRDQFQLRADEVLSPRTVAVTAVAGQRCLPYATPGRGGRSIFFPFERQGYSSVFEMQRLGDADIYDTVDVGAHVPRYVQGTITKLAVSSLQDMIVCRTDESADGLWVYKYLWAGNDKVLSSWSKWTLPGSTVLDCEWIDNALFILLERDGSTWLERIDVYDLSTDPTADYEVHLDRRVDETTVTSAVYSAGPGSTAITLPYAPSASAVVVDEFGVQVDALSIVGNVVTVNGDWSATSFFIGEPYTLTFGPTAPLIRKDDGTGRLVYVPGQPFITQAAVIGFTNTSHFKVNVDIIREGVAERSTYNYNAPDLGLSSTLLGSAYPSDGKFKVFVGGQDNQWAMTITSDSFLPIQLNVIRWENRTHSRHRSV